MIEETPVAMRRRLLLERAAWQLSRTQLSVTEISLNANYGSLEAFTRAFRKAFRVSPSLYRRIGATYTHLHPTNGIPPHSTTGTERLPPCWHASTKRTPSSMACLQRCAIAVLGTTRLSMRCANRRRPSPLGVCSLT